MTVALMPQRPPYVEFEQRAEEDRAASVKAGHAVFRDVDYATIRAIGAKDAVEKVAPDWLNHLDKLVMIGDYPREWAKFFREQYNEWKQGHSGTGVMGHHIKNWTGVSPAQAATLIAARVLTVEDLAAANEETLQRIGMGSRGLKDRAQAWLDTVKNNGSSEELALLREKTTAQDQTIEALIQRIEELQGEVKRLQSPEPTQVEEAPRGKRRTAA